MSKTGKWLCNLGTVLFGLGVLMLGAVLVSFPLVGVPQWFVDFTRIAFYGFLPFQAVGALLIAVGNFCRRPVNHCSMNSNNATPSVKLERDYYERHQN